MEVEVMKGTLAPAGCELSKKEISSITQTKPPALQGRKRGKYIPPTENVSDDTIYAAYLTRHQWNRVLHLLNNTAMGKRYALALSKQVAEKV
jgi:hypothetical protein